MRRLNSIIIEGTVSGIKKLKDETWLRLSGDSHKRFSKDQDQDLEVKVLVNGSLKKIVDERLELDNTIRVVGSIRNSSFEVIVFGEHIEFFPKKKE